MRTSDKVRIAAFGVSVAFLGILAVVAFRGMFGFDASKRDPEWVFRRFVRQDVPAEVKVQSAVGHSHFGGTSITLEFTASPQTIDALIKSKGLIKEDTTQTGAFEAVDWSRMESPEYYSVHAGEFWLHRMAVDRKKGLVFYFVHSP